MLSTRQRLIVLIVLIATLRTTRIIPKDCLTQFEGKIIAGSGVQKKKAMRYFNDLYANDC